MPPSVVTTEVNKDELKRPKRKRVSDMRLDFRRLKSASALRASVKAAMYESSCSYAGALELKRSALKEEPWPATEWPPYRLHQSTFEQLKQSVEKAKAALQDRSGLLGTATAFGDFYGGQLGQDTSATLGFGRTTRTDDFGSIDKGKSLGTEKLSSSLGKGYSTPSLTDTLRASKCSGTLFMLVRLYLAEPSREDEQLKVGYILYGPFSSLGDAMGKLFVKFRDQSHAIEYLNFKEHLDKEIAV